MIIYLFKTADLVLFRKHFEEAVAATRQGSIRWNASDDQVQKIVQNEYWGLCNTKGNTSSLLISPTNCFDVINALAKSLSSPLLAVRFQEKSFWDASLYVGQELKLNFSTSPTAWGKAEAKDYFCDPGGLSEIWDVPVKKFERYLVDWGLTKVWVEKFKVMSPTYKLRGTKAYPTDKHEYGDLYQGLDFISALGAPDPERGEQFIVHLPPIQRTRPQ
jgi:hypothetical protein